MTPAVATDVDFVKDINIDQMFIEIFIRCENEGLSVDQACRLQTKFNIIIESCLKNEENSQKNRPA